MRGLGSREFLSIFILYDTLHRTEGEMNNRKAVLIFVVLFSLALPVVAYQNCRFTVSNKSKDALFINVDGTQEGIAGYKDGRNVCYVKPGESCSFVENGSCHTLHASADMDIGAVEVASRTVSDCGLTSYTWTINQSDVH